jgi:hypothetical protein
LPKAIKNRRLAAGPDPRRVSRVCAAASRAARIAGLGSSRGKVSQANIGEIRPFCQIDLQQHVNGWARCIDSHTPYHTGNRAIEVRHEKARFVRNSIRRVFQQLFCPGE